MWWADTRRTRPPLSDNTSYTVGRVATRGSMRSKPTDRTHTRTEQRASRRGDQATLTWTRRSTACDQANAASSVEGATLTRCERDEEALYLRLGQYCFPLRVSLVQYTFRHRSTAATCSTSDCSYDLLVVQYDGVTNAASFRLNNHKRTQTGMSRQFSHQSTRHEANADTCLFGEGRRGPGGGVSGCASITAPVTLPASGSRPCSCCRSCSCVSRTNAPCERAATGCTDGAIIFVRGSTQRRSGPRRRSHGHTVSRSGGYTAQTPTAVGKRDGGGGIEGRAVASSTVSDEIRRRGTKVNTVVVLCCAQIHGVTSGGNGGKCCNEEPQT